MRATATLVFFCISYFICAQHNDLQQYSLPIDIPIYLSGTFGELRNSNIHAGIDIKTQGREGFPLKAVSNGYVSRVKVSTSGYGKVIYINHPDGKTSVYAHLNKFSAPIINEVRKKQYDLQSFEVEVFFKPTELPVSKNEIIGFSGNTGGSFGPHLHFELRETSTQKPFNPLLSHYDIEDSIRPVIHTLIAYPISEDAIVNSSKQKLQIPFQKINDSIYVSESIEAIGKIGLGIGTYDRQDNTYNKNGVYSINAKLNGTQIIDLKFSEIRFSDSEFLNTIIDYPRFSRTRQRILKLFRSTGNELDFFEYLEDGFIDVKIGKDYAYQLKVSDANSNNRYLFIQIKGKEQEVAIVPEEIPQGKEIEPNRDYLFLYDGAEIYIPKNTVYDNNRFLIEFENNKLQIKADHVALRKAINIKIKAPDLIEGHYLGIQFKNGETGFISKSIHNNHFVAKIKKTGIYTIAQDTIPPIIKPFQIYDKRWLSNFKSLRFTIDDKETGIRSYQATIDGKWVLFEYEPKKKEITFNFDEYFSLEGTKHKLKISVTDNVGNESNHELEFFRK